MRDIFGQRRGGQPRFFRVAGFGTLRLSAPGSEGVILHPVCFIFSMALRLASRNVFACVVEGSVRFCQWIDDPMAAIFVRALSIVNPGKVGAAAVTSGSGDLLVRVLADPVVKHHRTRTPGAVPSAPRHDGEGLRLCVKEILVYLL